MQSAALRALEFDRIREALARQAFTPLGRERAHGLDPSVDPGQVRARLTLATEADRYTREGGSLALSAPETLLDILEALNVADAALDPLPLLGLAGFIDSLDRLVSAILASDGSTRTAVPGLRAIAQRTAPFRAECAAVRRAIDPGGDITDDASPALREIRDRLRRQRARLRSSLEQLMRGRDTAKYLQDQIITDRQGRYVIVVRAEHRDAIPGIVHGSSASGASLYLEPLSTVEMNNDVVGLAEREREEIHRILLALTQAFRDRADDLDAAIAAAADFDELAAGARLSQLLEGVAPELVDDGSVDLRGARHPLLVLRSSASGLRDAATAGEARPPTVIVATDLLVVPPTRALVISGPNTGGKTVALKAVGLLTLMAQSGLLIPVEPGSRLTVFQSVFADIGDDQSIAASLSTFSARVANVVAMDRAMELPALVLLDEVGSGTDPLEGGALGTAVIDHFQHRGATVVATTHDDALKSYAATTAGVTTAAFGFNPETYAPTYRLLYGVPGRSLAIEIAERLGMPAAVIAAARERRTGRESALAEHLARVDAQLAALDRERLEVTRERDAMATERQRLIERETRLTEREAVLKRRLDDRVAERVREAKTEVERIVGQLKQKAETLTSRVEARTGRDAVISTGHVGELRAEARAALDLVNPDSDTPGSDQSRVLQTMPSIGDTVVIKALGATGVVRSISGKRIEVEVRGKRLPVGLAELRTPDAPSSEKRGGTSLSRAFGSKQTGPSTTGGLTGDTTAREIVVIGQTVDDAIGRLEKFVDAAILSDERRLRVVHGHGTGRLRDAVRAFLRDHPLVANVVPAGSNEGGDGATIAELKE